MERAITNEWKVRKLNIDLINSETTTFNPFDESIHQINKTNTSGSNGENFERVKEVIIMPLAKLRKETVLCYFNARNALIMSTVRL